MARGGRGAVIKGREGEREVVELLRAAGFRDAIVTAPMQAGHPRTFGDVGGVDGLRIAVRRGARVDVRKAIRDALEGPDAAAALIADEQPVVFHRDDHRRWFVTLDGEAFAWMLRQTGRRR